MPGRGVEVDACEVENRRDLLPAKTHWFLHPHPCLSPPLPPIAAACQGDDLEVITHTIPLVNTVFGAVCSACMTLSLSLFVWRLVRSTLSGKRWSTRRWNGCMHALTQGLVQLLNVSCFTAANARVVAADCFLVDDTAVALVTLQWTCWNCIMLLAWIAAQSVLPVRGAWLAVANRPDAIGIDLPLYSHWRKGGLWLAMQGLIVAYAVESAQWVDLYTVAASNGVCRDALAGSCRTPNSIVIITAICAAVIVLYVFLFFASAAQAFEYLRSRPYNQFKMGNVVLRLQVGGVV